jgi:hypothetical protein
MQPQWRLPTPSTPPAMGAPSGAPSAMPSAACMEAETTRWGREAAPTWCWEWQRGSASRFLPSFLPSFLSFFFLPFLLLSSFPSSFFLPFLLLSSFLSFFLSFFLSVQREASRSVSNDRIRIALVDDALNGRLLLPCAAGAASMPPSRRSHRSRGPPGDHRQAQMLSGTKAMPRLDNHTMPVGRCTNRW